MNATAAFRTRAPFVDDLASLVVPLRTRWADAAYRAISGASPPSAPIWSDRTPTGATTVADAPVIDELQRLYDFRDVVAVRRALREHPDVVALLFEAAGWVANVFDRDADVALEIVTDPEDEDDPGSLYALILTRLEPEQARPLMKRFRDSWWNQASIRTHDALNFALEYH